MSVLLLAGPPAVGHNTVAKELASRRGRIAVVDGDDVRPMLVRPAAEPGAGKEWTWVYRLGVRATCSLVRTYDDAGVDVIVLDVVEPDVLPIYREELDRVSSLAAVLLTAAPEVLIERDLRRDDTAGPESPGLRAWHQRIRHLHDLLVTHADLFDHRIDTTHQTPDQSAAAAAQIVGW